MLRRLAAVLAVVCAMLLAHQVAVAFPLISKAIPALVARTSSPLVVSLVIGVAMAVATLSCTAMGEAARLALGSWAQRGRNPA